MQVRRIGPDGAFVREFTEVRKRVESLESRPAGEQFISQSLTTRDPVTGVETVFGQLADGSFGIQPFVGDVTPPPIATKPVVSPQPGTLTIQWDGKFAGNADKPRDFEHVNVIGYKMVDGNDVLSLTVGVLRLKTDFAFVTTDVIAVGETWQFALESEDYNGNKANAGARTNTITMLSVMDDTNITDALNALAEEDIALNNRADATQDTLADAQDLADSLLAKGQNLALNGDFDAPLRAGKPVTGWPTLSLSSVQVSATGARTGTQYLRSAPTTNPAYGYTNDVTSASARTYRAEYWVRLEQTATVTDATATVGFYFTTTKLDGSLNTSPQVDTTVPVASLSTTVWTKVSKDYTVNIAVSKIKFGPRTTGNGNIYAIDSFKVTDVTDALAAQVKADSAFANAQQAADAAGTAQTAADGRSKNWYQDDAPAGVSHKNGDTWFDTNDGNKIYSWSTATSAWINRQDTAIAAAQVAVSGAQATADGKNTSYFGTTAPTGGTYKSGDLFFNTAEGNKLYLWSTTGGVTAWKPFQDAAIVIANQAATGAQATADGKNKSYYTDTAPANVPAGTLKQGDLWFNTGAGQGNRLSTWSGSAWQTTQDSALAMIEVAKKGRTFTGGVQPDVEFRNTSNIWIDTSLGDGFAVTKRWDTTANDWVPVKDKAISQAQTDAALDAQAKADAAYTAAINAQGYSKNPSFDNWTSTLPDMFTTFGTGPTKETSLFLRGPFAARFNCIDATSDRGLNFNGILDHAPNLEFFTVEVTFRLESGTSLNGAGVLLDWTGMTNNRTVLSLSQEVSAPVTGKWYRVSKTLRRPTNATGTWTGMDGYLMANYSGTPTFNGKAVKDIIFDWINIRPATAEEILSYGTTDQFTSLNTSVSAAQLSADGKNKVIYATTNATGTIAADGRPYVVGDTWFKRDTVSPFNIIGQWEFSKPDANPAAWYTRKIDGLNIANIDAGTITVGLLSGQSLSATAIDGKTITGALIQTNSAASSGIKLTTTELAGWDAGGQKNFSLTTGGTLAIRGTIQSGSTISGANLSASGIYTNALAQRGVKIMDTGINAWSSTGTPTFILDAATGQVEVPGLKAGSLTGDMIAGQTIAASNIAVSDFTNLATIDELNGITITSYGQTMVSAGYNRLVTDSGAFFFFTEKRGPVPFEVGDEIYYEFTAKATSATTANFSVYTYDAADASVSTSKSVSIGTTDTLISDSIAVTAFKANAKKFIVGLSSVANKGIQVKGVKVYKRHGGELIVDGSITTDHMGVGTIDAKVIAVGTLTGDKLEAGAVTAEKMTVGIGTNLIPDPGFLNSKVSGASGLRQTASTAGLTVAYNAATDNLDLTTSTTGTFYFRALGVTQSAAVYKDWIPVTPGEKYLFTVNITLPTGMTGDVRITGRTKDGQATSTSFALENSDAIPPVLLAFPTLVAGVNTIKYYAKVPANAYWMLPEIRLAGAIGTATIEPNSLSLRRRSTGELIVDGSITTTHMSVGTIDGGVISANTLKGTQLVANTISSGNLLLTSQDNLIENGGFEYGLTSWSSIPASFTLDTVNGRLGGQALKVTGITARVIGAITNPYFPIENDDSFRISGWVKTTATSGHRAEICMYYYDANKVFTVNTNYNIDPTGNPDPTGVADPATGIPLDNTWRYFSKLIKPPTGSYAYGRIRLNSTMTAASATMWFDDISVVRAANGTLIVDGSIDAQHITAGAIDATKLSANAVTASAVSAKSITADKLIISSSNNLLIEPDFGLNGISWTSGANISINATAGRGSTPALRVTGTTAAVNIYNLVAKGPDVTNKIAVDSDNRFRASFWVKSTEALPVNAIKLAYRRYTTASSQTAFTMVGNDEVLVPNTWTQFQAISPALGSTVIACDFYIIVDNLTTGGITDIDAVSVTRAADGKLVVDGAIDGKVITGALIQTSNTPATGSSARGLKLDTLGLRAYSPAGAATFNIDATSGSVSAVGGFQTGGNTSGILMDDNVFQSKPGIRFYTGTGESYLPAIWAADYSSVTYSPGQLVIMGSEQTANSSGRTELKIEPKGGGFRLGTIYGAYDDHGITLNSTGGVAINATDFTLNADTMRLKGKAPNTHTATDTIVYGAGAQTQSTSGTYTIIYPAPVTSGWRRVWCQMDGISSSGVTFVTQSLTATQFKVLYNSPANNNLSFNYQAVWMP